MNQLTPLSHGHFQKQYMAYGVAFPLHFQGPQYFQGRVGQDFSSSSQAVLWIDGPTPVGATRLYLIIVLEFTAVGQRDVVRHL